MNSAAPLSAAPLAGHPFGGNQRVEQLQRTCSDDAVVVESADVYAAAGARVDHGVVHAVCVGRVLVGDVTGKI